MAWKIDSSGWLVPPSRPYVVAEIGVNHGGSLDIAKKSIEAAAAAGADAVKFQMFVADEEVGDSLLEYSYERDGVRVSEAMKGMLERLELPKAWVSELVDHSKRMGVDFQTSVADAVSISIVEDLQLSVVKVASCDLTYQMLLQKIGRTKIPVILSTGMASLEEIEGAIEDLRDSGCPAILLLHCVSLYPTPDKEANLERILALGSHFGCAVGYSDHTLGIEACVAATALGAPLLEKHFTLDRTMDGPDHALSSNPAELAKLVESVHRTRAQMGGGQINPAGEQLSSLHDYRRSIVARRDIEPGEVIDVEMLAFRRPSHGLSPRRVSEVQGKLARERILSDEIITLEKLK